MVGNELAASAAQTSPIGASDFLGNPQALLDPVAAGLNQALFNAVSMLPNLVAAVILVIFGWFVGSIVARIVKKIFEFIKLEEFLKSHKVEDALGSVQISKVFVQLIKYYVIFVFLQAAVSIFGLESLSVYLDKVIDYAPKVFGGIIVVVLAALIGELVKEKILEVHEKESYMRLLANGTKYLLVFMGVVMGLDTLGFPTTILTSTFITVVQAIGFAFALAVGLAFGFGGQEAAKDWIKEWRKRLHF